MHRFPRIFPPKAAELKFPRKEFQAFEKSPKTVPGTVPRSDFPRLFPPKAIPTKSVGMRRSQGLVLKFLFPPTVREGLMFQF